MNVCFACVFDSLKKYWIIITVLMSILLITFLCLVFVVYLKACSEGCYENSKRNHHLRGISDKEIEFLSSLLQMRSGLRDIFRNVNLVRPVGSQNHAIVREFIKKFLINLQWDVEEDRFVSDTVIGEKEFTNIIGTQNPDKSRRLILACHYDSLMKEGFYTSTDSALPCSLMLSVAEILTPFLQLNKNIDVSLQLVFFDGEEAFISWSDSDSLYGSKHLANVWHNDRNLCECSKLHRIECKVLLMLRNTAENGNLPLDSLILLDLLGARAPRFFKFDFKNRFFDSFVTIEKRLQNRGRFRDASGHPYFQTYSVNNFIEDDHVPFMVKNVPYIHLITVPFPPTWHTIHDNAANIDWDVSNDLEMILSVFLAEYFHLSVQEPNDIYRSLQVNY